MPSLQSGAGWHAEPPSARRQDPATLAEARADRATNHVRKLKEEKAADPPRRFSYESTLDSTERGAYRKMLVARWKTQFEKQADPKRPPTWFRAFADIRDPPRPLDVMWRHRYDPFRRTPEEEHWWMLAWMDTKLVVPSGLLQGKRWRLEPWQFDFLDAAFAPGVREATLSIARKNGKSGLAAAIVAYHLSRYGAREGWRGVGVSVGGPQSDQLWQDIFELCQAGGLTDEIIDRGDKIDKRFNTIRSRPGGFSCEEGAQFKLLAANPKASGVGASADLILIDELGAYDDNRRPLVSNMETAVSARNGRSIALSVEGVANSFMEERERRAETDPACYYMRFSAPEDSALDDPKAWRAANPSLDRIKSREYMERMSRRALTVPAEALSFANLDLNMRVTGMDDCVATPVEWSKIEAETLPERKGPWLLGIDLGGARSFSAAVAIWPETGRFESLLCCGNRPNLTERGRADAVGDRYLLMHRQGTLVLAPGEIPEHAWFIGEIEKRFGPQPPALALADHYKHSEFTQALRKSGVAWRAAVRRMGSGPHGAEDLRAFQRLIVRRDISVRRSLAWASALMETKVKYSETTGFPSIHKRRDSARIDLVSAALLAAGAALRWLEARAVREREDDSGADFATIE